MKYDELVVNSLASAEAVLSETEKELGVAVADIGAGTIDLALFADGSPFHTSVLPVGGNNVTNDVAIGLKTTLQVAEDLKIQNGTADLRGVEEGESIPCPCWATTRAARSTASRCARSSRRACARCSSCCAPRCAAPGTGCCRPGVILTGGGAQLAGTAELGRDVLEMPVRIAAPAGSPG